MLIRHLLASIVHNQRRRILTAPLATAFVSPFTSARWKGQFNEPQSESVKGRQPTATKGENFRPASQWFRRTLKKTLLFLLLGRRYDNLLLANTALNRALKYSGIDGSMATEVSSPSPNQSIESEELRDSSPRTRQTTSDSSIETLDRPGALEELRESYTEARKGATSWWLNYANNSCYIYLYRGGGEPSTTIAAFDLDGTLIRPKSNKRIPRSATDWDFFSVWTKVKLQQCLRDHRARFVIFTNQNGIGLNIVPLDEVQKRIELVVRRLDIPCIVFMAVEKDQFRKPQTGMFQLFSKSFNDSLQLDTTSSFYCGDAIGHPSHSDADIKFAQKLALPFLTPEKFVRGVKPKLVV